MAKDGAEDEPGAAGAAGYALAATLSAADQAAFDALQARLAPMVAGVTENPAGSRAVVIAPSLTLDRDVLAKIDGIHHYEERMLCFLLMLRLPRTEVVYITSKSIHPSIIDYYLHLLPGVPGEHARRRLTLLSCDDASPEPLAKKILARPRIIERIAKVLARVDAAHLNCFNVTAAERALALTLNIPLYGCDPALAYWGSKSGSRRLFREAGVELPTGFEDLRDGADLAEALAALKASEPVLARAVVKMNDGFSGEGNAVFSFAGAEPRPSAAWAAERLPEMAFEAEGMDWAQFSEKFESMGGVVEAFVPGARKASPSAQLRVTPGGRVETISTHDQVLGGPSGQIFLGARFPAHQSYRLDIQARGRRVAEVLQSKGVVGRFGVDFISVQDEVGAWRHHAIEVNLRKGGTTHPFEMLQFLTDGEYDEATGGFVTAYGQPRCYYASDNVEAVAYRGLTPDDLIDIAVMNGLHFHAAAGEGVAFHLIGALSEFGKLGMVCIGEDQARADALFARTVAVLDREARAPA